MTTEKGRERLHVRLSRLISERKLTHKEIQRLIGEAVEPVSESTVYRWLSGKGEPSLAAALTLARALGVSLDELVGGEPYVGPSSGEDRPAEPPLGEEERHILWLVGAVGLEESVRRLTWCSESRPRSEQSDG